MALFNRKKNATVLPEVDQYYEGERRDRAWLAWVLALVSIAAVAAIVIALFMGGRWIYRQATDSDEPEVPVAVNDNNGTLPSFDGEPEDTDQGDQDEDSEADQEQPQEDTEGTVDAPARTDVPSRPMPNTGPGNIAGIFIGTTAVAGGAHYAVNRKRLSRKD